MKTSLVAICCLFLAGCADDSEHAQEQKTTQIQTFKDCDQCPEMVVIPAGSFEMGAKEYDTAARAERELPRVAVTIPSPFAVGRFEVTYTQYLACHEAGGCQSKPHHYGWGGKTQPVTGIDWPAMNEYVQWLSNMTGHAYSLLSEAEWEYAARGGTSTIYWWGDELGVQRAKCRGCDGNGFITNSFKAPTPVGNFPANPFGLHDMTGNVSEWLQDCFHETHEGRPSTSVPRVDGNCDFRIVRGASFLSPVASRARLSSRQARPPHMSNQSIGFRVRRTLQPVE